MNSEFEFVDAALEYAEKGLAVFPLKPRMKTPIYKGGFHNATTNPKTIKKWWRKNPDANIGIATGQKSGGLVVFDFDINEKKGKNGSESLKNWLNEKRLPDLPDTVTSITGGGGCHYLYRDKKHTHKTRAGILPGVDIRADGGYIVAPQSIHPNGNRYEWELSGHIDDMDIFDISEGDNSASAFLEFTDNKEDDENGTGFVSPNKIESGVRNKTLYSAACSMQSKGYADETIRAAIVAENKAKCGPPLDDDELDKIINSALKYPKGHSNNNPVILPGGNEVSDVMQMLKVKRRELNGEIVATPIDTIDNVVTILENDKRFKGKIRTNILANCPYYFGDIPWRTQKDELDTMGEWNDTDDAELRRVIQNEYGIIRLNKQNYNDGFRIVADNNSFNPLVDYFEELPKWDGVERIKHLLPDFLGAEESEYTYEVMKLVMLGALSRAYNPGCKFDYMLVLVGSQGIGKSYFLKKLAINDIWFEDGIQTSLDKKDAVEKMRGKWIIEFGEMAALKSTKDVEAIKSFTTACTDTYREPYARRTTERKRMCVFTGTTNNMRFLTDRTGNRRFLPIVVTGKKTKNLFDDDTDEYINMAWSEALYLFNQANRKPLLVLPERLAAEVLQHQENHKEDNPAVGLVQYYLDNRVDGYPVCAVEIAEKVLGIELGKVKRSTVNEIHDIMKYEIHGWELAHNQKCGKYGSQKNCYIKKVEWQEVTEDSFDD